MIYRITARYGETSKVHQNPHTGIDFGFPMETPLKSLREGVVQKVTHYEGNIGNGVIIKWENGQTAIYGHLSKISVSEGEHVSPGEVIGLSGNSGRSTGAHLHFGLKENGNIIDPSQYIDEIQHMNDKGYLLANKPNLDFNIPENINILEDTKNILFNFIFNSPLLNNAFFTQLFHQYF